MTSYQIPVGVRADTKHDRHIFLTSSGGYILTDSTLIQIWQYADGRTDKEIIAHFSSKAIKPDQLFAAIVCLIKAGLLESQDDQKIAINQNLNRSTYNTLKPGNVSVSAIIVGHNSRIWLEKCFQSLLAQKFSSLEILLVDNDSTDGTVDWLSEAFPMVQVIALDHPLPLAKALNLGIQSSRGDYYLLLNPDVELNPDVLSILLNTAQSNPSCAAVVPKLRFTWAPAFLNGLGNFVGAVSWGVDCGLGHLDLGQFDKWHEVPSACFAATLISSASYTKVGPFDEKYPLYYEDSDWSYRARMLGYSILAAPKAVVYHGYGGQLPTTKESGITDIKLQQVSYGRLRFATKILGRKYLWRFLSSYIVEDAFRGGFALIKGDWDKLRSIVKAWSAFMNSHSELNNSRGNIQQHRIYSDEVIFCLQRKTPMPFIWSGLPCLTWSIVRNHYLPLIGSRQFQEMQEIPDRMLISPMNNENSRSIPRLQFIYHVLQNEGIRASLYWTGKILQWLMIKP